MAREEFAAGSTIIQQSEPGSKFYVLEQGACEVVVNGEKVADLEQGKGFGELALMYDSPRAATVRATQAAVVWSLDRCVAAPLPCTQWEHVCVCVAPRAHGPASAEMYFGLSSPPLPPAAWRRAASSWPTCRCCSRCRTSRSARSRRPCRWRSSAWETTCVPDMLPALHWLCPPLTLLHVLPLCRCADHPPRRAWGQVLRDLGGPGLVHQERRR